MLIIVSSNFKNVCFQFPADGHPRKSRTLESLGHCSIGDRFVFGFLLSPAPALIVAGMWGVHQLLANLSVSVVASLPLNKQRGSNCIKEEAHFRSTVGHKKM